MAPLPRVAFQNTGQAQAPTRRLGDRDSDNRSQSRFIRNDINSNGMHSLMFPGEENQPHGAIPVNHADKYRTSHDNPLMIPAAAPPSPGRYPPAKAPVRNVLEASGMQAGRTSNRSASVRSVLTGEDDPAVAPVVHPDGERRRRTEYQHPTYTISRSSRAEVKDLLYGGGEPAAAALRTAPPPPAEHPARAVYEHLRGLVGNMPRDIDGNIDERGMLMALSDVGIELSVDGFAELLARCDVSPSGFPSLDEFLGCLSRPHRDLPPPSTKVGPPTSSGSTAGKVVLVCEEPTAAPESAEAPQSTGAPEAAPAAADAIPDGAAKATASVSHESHETWRHMKVADQIKRPTPVVQHAFESSLKGVPKDLSFAKPKGSFPLGTTSYVTPIGYGNEYRLLSKKSHANNQHFSKQFNPDHFF